MAILDYLDRLHPTDQDTFTIVTLHFTMYREIAHMLEEAAKARLRTLYQTPIGKYGGAGTSIGNYGCGSGYIVRFQIGLVVVVVYPLP